MDPAQSALRPALDAAVQPAQMPLDPSMLESLGKPIAELLSTIFRTPNGSGLPSKLRLINWNGGAGTAALRGLRKGEEAFEATPAQLDALINDGTVGIDQPPQSAVAAIQKKLAALLGGS